MVFLSTDNCLKACCCQCFRSSLDIERVVELGNVALGWMEKEGNSVEKRNDGCLEASAYNAVVDEVNYTNECESMATFETHFDEAMLMDYKVMVVLLFASLANR